MPVCLLMSAIYNEPNNCSKFDLLCSCLYEFFFDLRQLKNTTTCLQYFSLVHTTGITIFCCVLRLFLSAFYCIILCFCLLLLLLSSFFSFFIFFTFISVRPIFFHLTLVVIFCSPISLWYFTPKKFDRKSGNHNKLFVMLQTP